jgi:hypothetical protein
VYPSYIQIMSVNAILCGLRRPGGRLCSFAFSAKSSSGLGENTHRWPHVVSAILRVHLTHLTRLTYFPLPLNPKPIISRPAAERQPILNRDQWRLFSPIIAYYRLLSANREFSQGRVGASDNR